MKMISGYWSAVTTFLLTLSLTPGVSAMANWNAVVAPSGGIVIESHGHEVGSILPGLFEATWQSASMNARTPSEVNSNGTHRGQITAPGGCQVDCELRVSNDGGVTNLEYRLTPQSNIQLNSLHVAFTLPAANWAGGKYTADETSGDIPVTFKNTVVNSAPITTLQLADKSGDWLKLEFPRPTQVLVQDDRMWGQSFSVRIGPNFNDAESWPAGKSLTIGFKLTGNNAVRLEEDGPVTIEAGPDWIPLDVTLDIEQGSALDFSHVIPRHSFAGEHGRVIVNPDGKFAFSNHPNQSARFYGVNLCFSAQYLSHENADRLAERLWRLGYNALRIHHYESELVDRSSRDGIRLMPDKLDQFDYLLAAMKRRGIYVTTDLFVSRPVAMSTIYPDAEKVPGQDNDIGMDEYKLAVHINDRAFNDFKAFSRLLLNHENPYTKLRYADDPMLAWLSLVNEDNPGNFASQLTGPLHDDLQGVWNRWLAARYDDRTALVNAIGELPEDQSPIKDNLPLQNVYDDSLAAIHFNVFLAEVEQSFFDRTRTFLRDELRCHALLTDINAWHNPLQSQAVRASFDYVDDHFYVDHPKFLERPWSLPSSCPNTSPIADGATGGRNCAFTRLFGKPFTITEFNYSSPGRFRGVGGILTGTLGSLQDWDGIWRFAYAHNRDNVSEPGPLNYFDVSADPLNQAAERASLCLFLRGDMQPAEHSVSIDATSQQLMISPTSSRDKTPSWNGVAWLSKVGWSIDSHDTKVQSKFLSLPLNRGEIDPFAVGAGDLIVQTMRQRGWLGPDNRTDYDVNQFQSDNGEVTIDAPANTLTLDTARTVGGFAPAGRRIETTSALIEIHDTDATVWISSLDSEPISASKRLLITHLTDLQNSGARYGDRGRKVLLQWGGLPHLVQAGTATVTVQIANAVKAKVYGLSTSGKRQSTIVTATQPGKLVIPLAVQANGKARMMYEVVVE